MRKLTVLLMAAAVVLSGSVPAGAETVTERILLESGDFITPGCGEDLDHTGYLLAVFTTTETPSGNVHVGFHFSPQGITATGLTTGATYQGTGVTRGSFTEAKASVFTEVNNFRIIGRGQTPDLIEAWTIHMTINANGEVTAEVERIVTECRQT